MASAPVLGGAKRSVDLDETAFGARFNGPLIHESVRAEMAARRRGTAATRTRGLVSGGGAKPWRQKGTGRARAGSSRSPVWTGGGTVFGPHPRSYTFKVNRKERRAALRSALSLHADRGSLAILDAAAFTEPSTRSAAKLLLAWGQPRATLVVVTAQERDAALSFRNIERVAVLEPSSVGIVDIVAAASLLCSDAALAELTARAAGEAAAAGEPAAAGPTADAAPSSPAPSKRPARASAASPEAPASVPAPAANAAPAAEPAAAPRPAAKAAAKAAPAAEPAAESMPAAKPAAKAATAPKAAPKPKTAPKPAAKAEAAAKKTAPVAKPRTPKAPKDEGRGGKAATTKDAD
ncbi:MAG: 50S ribosomal protein L4 [Solirubrobacteraceae bacterium]|jgi:large subunit ribosomal protein L4